MTDRRAASLVLTLPRRVATERVAAAPRPRLLASDGVRLLGLAVWILAILTYAVIA